MKIHRSVEDVSGIKAPVLTIGTFDGFHKGHRTIIDRLNQLAKESGGESVVLTFSPHPRIVLGKAEGMRLITTMEEKANLLDQSGVDHLIVVPFTKELSQLTPKAFVHEILVENIHPKKVVIGYDHRFGKNRSGDINFLREVAPIYNFEVEEIEKQLVDDVSVSSTKIRKALEAGKIRKAERLLGHPFTLHGTVIKGDKVGRELGYPTANIQVEEPYKIIPHNGIYGVHVQVANRTYGGMLSIGKRPTFEGKKRAIEAHIFDFKKDIYGQPIGITFIDWIRGQEKFPTKEALIDAMRKDEKKAKKLLE